MSERLVVVPVKHPSPIQPAAMHELAAAKYIGTNRTYFRQLVERGVIPFTVHLVGKARLYLRSDLDAYLCSLKKRSMASCENPPSPKEVAQ